MKSPLRLFAERKPRWYSVLIGLIPFVLIAAVYLVASDARLEENPQDKLLPGIEQIVGAFDRMALTPDRRQGTYLMLQDTLSSLQRLLLGVGLSAFAALALGLTMGVFGRVEAVAKDFLTTVSMIPPLAVLPILFIAFGVGEVGKVALIFLGTFPLFARDVYLSTCRIPKEQIVKAMTLGASPGSVAFRIVLPQIVPRLLQSVRLGLGAAWLFLIAAEAIASNDGLGYRIFLMRRYLSMDVILLYVTWITLLGFLLDWALRGVVRWKYSWYEKV